jgi:hypothetical protein
MKYNRDYLYHNGDIFYLEKRESSYDNPIRFMVKISKMWDHYNECYTRNEEELLGEVVEDDIISLMDEDIWGSKEDRSKSDCHFQLVDSFWGYALFALTYQRSKESKCED